MFTEIFEMFPDTVSVVTAELSEEDGKTRFTATGAIRRCKCATQDRVRNGEARISYDRLEDLVAELQRSSERRLLTPLLRKAFAA